MSTKISHAPAEPSAPAQIERLAAAVDSHPEGDDAATLAAALRHPVEGDLVLVSIGHTTRQLIEQERWAVAIAPRGLRSHGALTIKRVGVGFDDSPESRAALAMAAAIATGCGARLMVRGVIDDRIPALAWSGLWVEPFRECWSEVMDEEVQSLRHTTEALTAALPIPVSVEIDRDTAAASLLELSLATDLLVIGSRRWGPLARLVLGGTGEALVHGAHCSLLIVPRPDAAE